MHPNLNTFLMFSLTQIPPWIHQYREFAITSCDVMLCYRHQMSPMKLWMIWWKHQIWHVITITTTYIFSLGRCWVAPCFDCNSIRTILQVLIEWPPCWCGFVLLSRVPFGECNEVWFRSSLFLCINPYSRRLNLGDPSHRPFPGILPNIWCPLRRR